MQEYSLTRSEVSVGPDLLDADLFRIPADGHKEILLLPTDLEHPADGRPHRS